MNHSQSNTLPTCVRRERRTHGQLIVAGLVTSCLALDLTTTGISADGASTSTANTSVGARGTGSACVDEAPEAPDGSVTSCLADLCPLGECDPFPIDGTNNRGNEVLRAVQLAGTSRSGGFGFGKLWFVANMSRLHVTDARFSANDPSYNPNDSAMVQVHCHV